MLPFRVRGFRIVSHLCSAARSASGVSNPRKVTARLVKEVASVVEGFAGERHVGRKRQRVRHLAAKDPALAGVLRDFVQKPRTAHSAQNRQDGPEALVPQTGPFHGPIPKLKVALPEPSYHFQSGEDSGRSLTSFNLSSVVWRS